MTTFENMGIPQSVLASLKKMNFKTPTPIQEQAIPVAMDGRDILGSAQTGTGKTAAFTIPMISRLIENDNCSALILLPTRELAGQVQEAVKNILGKNTDIRSALLIGGDSMVKQLQQLKRSPRIIVGTPGRINDHLIRRSLKLNSTGFLVLDETDRMLDMGFGVQLEAIAKYLPDNRQTLMFSATLPKNIVNLSRKYLNEPVRIAVGESNAVAPKIRQEIIKTSDTTKYEDLITQINTHNGSLLVFVKTKFGADKLALKLKKESFAAGAIHGDLRQTKREKVISDFRQQKFRILVATDIAARGLDIPHIENVVNYDLPQCPEDYIHRIGRTARAGAEGTAINFLTPKDKSKWKEIHKLLNPGDKAQLDDLFPSVQHDRTNKNRPAKKYAPRKAASRVRADNPFQAFEEEITQGRFNKNTKSFGPSHKKKAKQKKDSFAPKHHKKSKRTGR